jgi:hypothetical protein
VELVQRYELPHEERYADRDREPGGQENQFAVIDVEDDDPVVIVGSYKRIGS